MTHLLSLDDSVIHCRVKNLGVLFTRHFHWSLILKRFFHLNIAKIRSALTEWDSDLLNRSALSFQDA